MSFIDYPSTTHFPISNIPFGIISTTENPRPRPATAIGDYAIDIQQLVEHDLLDIDDRIKSSFMKINLNHFAGLDKVTRQDTRLKLQRLLMKGSDLDNKQELQAKVLVPLKQVEMHLPMDIGDFTDFSASKIHTLNMGELFTGKRELAPHWINLPIAYHARSSSVVVSGSEVKRPLGQSLNVEDKSKPIFGPSRKLDIEVEFGCFISKPNNRGQPVSISDANDHIFGYVVVNDWSARDHQGWEMAPLGPFNGKNFATTISPWVVTPEALVSAKCVNPSVQEAPLLPYLDEKDQQNALDITFKIEFKPKDAEHASVISIANSKDLYYTFPQMIAHHTIGGCNLRTGDLIGSGTLSGTTPDSFGSLIELSMGGQTPFKIGESTRSFLEDGDFVNISASASNKEHGDILIGFGDCSGIIVA